MNLPVNYDELSQSERKIVRELYIKKQKGKCHYCSCDLSGEPPLHIKNKKVFWDLFPPNFLKYKVHLQHNHSTGMTEGAVHALCNAVMWQYEGR